LAAKTTVRGGEPGRQLLQPAERAGGLNQLALAIGRGATGLEIGPRQMRHQRADLIEARNRLGHRYSPLRTAIYL
jgi:hypothetical protein